METLPILYKRLPRGPNGLGRDAVARNQRARMYGGMIEALSRGDYRSTTVAHVIRLAGVSRRAFYEQFTCKEDCFLATYDVVVARARKRAVDAYSGERGWANRVHAACKLVLDDVAADPRGAHLVLVDSAALGAHTSERSRLVTATFERLLSDAFSRAPDGRELPPVAAKAIVEGVRHIVRRRLVEAREGELLGLTDEILDWIESYRSSPAPAIQLNAPIPPPRMRTVSRAPPPRGAGTASIVEALLEEARMAVPAPIIGGPAWPRAVHRAICLLAEFLAANAAVLEGPGSDIEQLDPLAVVRVVAAIQDVTGLAHEDAPRPLRGPDVAPEAVAGAVWAIIAGCIARGAASRLPCAADQLAFIVLAPYLGPRAAAEQIRQAAAPLHAA